MTSLVAPEGTVMLNTPSLLVDVPEEEPFTITDALETGFPSASDTLPVMVRVWASSCPQRSSILPSRSTSFLILVSFGFYVKRYEPILGAILVKCVFR
jgi:hypothetical protein